MLSLGERIPAPAQRVGPGGPARLRGGLRLRPRLWVVGPLALFALLRVPSLLEPHWYTDEAGYVTSARALLQGKTLYAQLWTNKPPIHLWTVAAWIQVFGTSEAALHVLTLLTGLLTLLAVAYAGCRLLGRPRTVIALLIGAILLGTPLFDGELLLPESLLIAPVSWAGAVLLTRVTSPDIRRWPVWPAAVGALAALAVAYQQTAIAETCAFGLVIALVPAGSRSRRLALYAGTVVVLTGAWLVPSILTAGVTAVGYALAGFYVGFTQGRWTGGFGATAFHLLLPLGALALLVFSAWLRRRDHSAAWGLWLWAGAALLIPAVARQPYAHYLVPSLAPSALAASSVRVAIPTVTNLPQRLAALGLAAGAGLAGWGASATSLDWVGAGGSDLTLAMYYGGAASVLTRHQSLLAWQDGFDYRVSEDRQVNAWLSLHGLQGSTAVVWSADAWLYADSQLQLLLPTPPIYNDEVLLGSDPGTAQVVGDLDPEIVITEGSARSALPAINAIIQDGYRQVDQAGSEIVWLRDDRVTP
ncbi:MAG TPA: glycosyltransferase family 39 protein [Candidatus Binatia bacterium]|nr:glycosyltransferase family 39 protein [Candidatus Binatia bacterium]